MKLVKSEVDEVTSDAISVAMLALACLKLAGCPYVEHYEFVENFSSKIDKHREALGLEEIAPKEMKANVFSKLIAQQVVDGKLVGGGKALKLTSEQASKLQALLESFQAQNEGVKGGKKPIGFSLEDVDFDPKKVN